MYVDMTLLCLKCRKQTEVRLEGDEEHVAKCATCGGENYPLPRSLLFPKATKIADVFGLLGPYKTGARDPTTIPAQKIAPVTLSSKDNVKINVGPYCYVRSKNEEHPHAIAVKLREDLLPTLAAHTVASDYDSLFYELVFRDDGTVLVISKNNLILASRYLALLPASEVEKALAPYALKPE